MGPREGLTAVQRLDAIVVNKLRDNPAELAAWASARHVERAHAKAAQALHRLKRVRVNVTARFLRGAAA